MVVALVPVVCVKQLAFDVIITYTSSPFAKFVLVYVTPVIPVGLLFKYQAYVGTVPPLVGVAVNVTEVPAQMAPVGLAAMVTDGVIKGLTSIVMLLLLTVVGEAQSALLRSVTLITSLSASPVVEYVVAFVAPGAGFPLTNQEYVGVFPGLTGTAVKVTFAPAQIVPVGAAVMAIDGTKIGLTVMVTAGLLTLLALGQVAPLTIVTVITSPFTREVVVKVLFVSPGCGIVFKFHWYVGPGAKPPLLGIAVNVTEVPAQIAPTGMEFIVTLGTTTGLTVIVVVVLVAVGVVTQPRLEVITT